MFLIQILMNGETVIYEGRIEEAGRDHLIISDANTGVWYLIRMIYLNYVEFEEKI